MKKFIFLFIILNSALGFSQEAEFSLLEKVYKFPKTNEGVILNHNFKFENSGDSPLIISDYNVSCACTKVTLPNKPILPGEKGVIKVSFDTKGKYYLQDRIVYLTTNTSKKTKKLRFKVYVIPIEEQ
ncbi:MAG: DUF1573 domain-containing protein [Crocinitomicaceae bacterium]